MSLEPLKNKRLRIVLSPTGKFRGVKVTKDGDLLYYEDVKLAVQGLLEEIEKVRDKYLDTYSHPDDEALRRVLEAFSIEIEEKIKKWFGDVL